MGAVYLESGEVEEIGREKLTRCTIITCVCSCPDRVSIAYGSSGGLPLLRRRCNVAIGGSRRQRRRRIGAIGCDSKVLERGE